ncbi:hypothetical protein C0J52_22325 [Blattella germanica]|nr:hypothetical protein C0J52_22325 [Blattella germanica]
MQVAITILKCPVVISLGGIRRMWNRSRTNSRYLANKPVGVTLLFITSKAINSVTLDSVGSGLARGHSLSALQDGSFLRLVAFDTFLIAAPIHRCYRRQTLELHVTSPEVLGLHPELEAQDRRLQTFPSRSKVFAASSLWCTYSKLKTILRVREKVDVSSFTNVVSFLKKMSVRHVPRKSNVLSRSQIDEFLLNAPDDVFLLIKVVIAFGVFGAYRRQELHDLCFNDVKVEGSVLVGLQPKRANFVICGKIIELDELIGAIGERIHRDKQCELYSKKREVVMVVMANFTKIKENIRTEEYERVQVSRFVVDVDFEYGGIAGMGKDIQRGRDVQLGVMNMRYVTCGPIQEHSYFHLGMISSPTVQYCISSWNRIRMNYPQIKLHDTIEAENHFSSVDHDYVISRRNRVWRESIGNCEGGLSGPDMRYTLSNRHPATSLHDSNVPYIRSLAATVQSIENGKWTGIYVADSGVAYGLAILRKVHHTELFLSALPRSERRVMWGNLEMG